MHLEEVSQLLGEVPVGAEPGVDHRGTVTQALALLGRCQELGTEGLLQRGAGAQVLGVRDQDPAHAGQCLEHHTFTSTFLNGFR